MEQFLCITLRQDVPNFDNITKVKESSLRNRFLCVECYSIKFVYEDLFDWYGSSLSPESVWRMVFVSLTFSLSTEDEEL